MSEATGFPPLRTEPNAQLPSVPPWRVVFFVAASVVLIGIVLVILSSVRAPHTVYVAPVDRIASMSDCVERYAPKLKALDGGGPDMTGSFTLCYDITAAALLADEQYNRNENLAFQMSENVVLMWMVVAITVSGVTLAGLQLYASFKLASVGKGTLAEGGTLKLENGKVVVQSSIVGVIILAISFAFFMVFVRDVYSITEVPGSGVPQVQATRPNMGRANGTVPEKARPGAPPSATPATPPATP